MAKKLFSDVPVCNSTTLSSGARTSLTSNWDCTSKNGTIPFFGSCHLQKFSNDYSIVGCINKDNEGELGAEQDE